MDDQSAPKITHVEQIDNSVVIDFDDQDEPTVFPADLLHAARNVADVLIDLKVSEELDKIQIDTDRTDE